MKLINAMFGKKLGGIEQVFLDYNHAFSLQRNQVVPIIHPAARIANKLSGHFYGVKNYGEFDIFAIHKLRKIIETEAPKAIITHGRRAARLFRKASHDVPIISVCHNYLIKPLLASDAFITITADIKNKLQEMGVAADKIYHVPNMIQIPESALYQKPEFRKPPVIGFMGRLIHRKGADVFLKALAKLNEDGIAFKAVIAGEGEEKAKIVELAKTLGISDRITMIGWVENKEEFYRSLDIFCMPSYHEPFGLVLLEAFLFSKPVIASFCEGPREIVTPDQNCLIFPPGDFRQLASKLKILITDQDFSSRISFEGYTRVQDFSALSISRLLQRTIEEVCFKKFNF